MKKILTLLLTLPLLTLTGCAKYDKDPDADSYFCNRIIHKMHAIPHRYKASGSNRQIATTQSRLQKEYRQFDCERFDPEPNRNTKTQASSYNLKT